MTCRGGCPHPPEKKGIAVKMKKEIICTVCPRGCAVTVEGSENEIKSIEGYSCKRGMEFAKSEFTNPVRILTTLVKIDGVENELLPVRSDKPIPKDKIFECMEIIKKTIAKLPQKRYNVIIGDICGLGANIVATKDIG